MLVEPGFLRTSLRLVLNREHLGCGLLGCLAVLRGAAFVGTLFLSFCVFSNQAVVGVKTTALDCANMNVPGYNGGKVDLGFLDVSVRLNVSDNLGVAPVIMGYHSYSYFMSINVCSSLNSRDSCVLEGGTQSSEDSFACIEMSAKRLPWAPGRVTESFVTSFPVLLSGDMKPRVTYTGVSSSVPVNQRKIVIFFSTRAARLSPMPVVLGDSKEFMLNLVLEVRCNSNPTPANSALRLSSFNDTLIQAYIEDPAGCISASDASVLSGWAASIVMWIFIGILVYFVLGTMYRRFVLHEIGTNQIPHFQFISSLPGLLATWVSSCVAGTRSRMENFRNGSNSGYVRL